MAVCKLVVEVLGAKALTPKRGHGSSNAFCEVEYNGQQKRTRVKRQCLDPTWNEKFEFEIADSENDIKRPREKLKINLYHQVEVHMSFGEGHMEKRWLGRVSIPVDVVSTRPHVEWYSLQDGRFEGELGLRIWRQTAEPSSQDLHPDFLWPSPPAEMSERLGANFQCQLVMQDDEPIDTTKLLEVTESDTTKLLEVTESATENLLNERAVARAAHLKEVKDLVNANLSRVDEVFEDSSHIEWSMQDTSPHCRSQIVEQSLQRSESMLESKQTLEKFLIVHNLIPRIDGALENERQLLKSIIKTARDATEQQKELRDMEQSVYRANLALIRKYNQEQMELFETFQQEKEHRLNLWAASRRDSLDRVRSVESNSQPLVARLNTLVETTRKHEKKLEAEVLRLLGGEAIEEASSSSKSECRICFDYIEGPSSQQLGTPRRRDDLKQRSCLIPCNHAMICLPCATEIWESTKLCPFCKVMLTTKPRALYLG